MRTLLIVSFLLSLAVAEETAKITYSDPMTIKFANTSQGTMDFTYQTYLEGDAGFQVAWLKGKIEIKDNQQINTQMLEYEDYQWASTDQVRLAVEFVIPGQELRYREQLRFKYYLDDTKNTESKFSAVSNVKDFNGTTAEDWQLGHILTFLMLPGDSDKLESGKNGVEIIDQKVDKDAKTIMVEFKRPLDVSYDTSFYLVPGGDYKIFIQWGIFADDKDDKQSRVKGMIKRLTKKGNNDVVDLGAKWVMPKPPGWEELQAKLLAYDPSASSARKLSMFSSFLSCSFLLIIQFANIF